LFPGRRNAASFLKEEEEREGRRFNMKERGKDESRILLSKSLMI